MPSRTENFSETMTEAAIRAEAADILCRISSYRQQRASSASEPGRRVECACESVAQEMARYVRPDGLPTPAVLDRAEELINARNKLREWAIGCQKAGVPTHVVLAWLRGVAFHLCNEVPGEPPAC